MGKVGKMLDNSTTKSDRLREITTFDQMDKLTSKFEKIISTIGVIQYTSHNDHIENYTYRFLRNLNEDIPNLTSELEDILTKINCEVKYRNDYPNG